VSDERAVAAAVQHREPELWEFLEHVVNLDSPSFAKELTDRVGRAFAERAEALGFDVELDRQSEHGDNVVARIEPDVPEDQRAGRILLVGHMDTVFGPGETRERPFRREGGRAYGPGILDMKTGLVIGLEAVAVARELADEWRTGLTFIMNTDEEPGSPRSRDVILRQAPRHDLALVLEPGTGTDAPMLTMGRKGVGILRVRVEGASAHAGVEPELGVNSVVDMAHKIIEISGLADPAAGTTVTTGVVHGGTHPYVVPEECLLELDVRVPTLAEQERVLAGLEEIVARQHVEGAKAVLSGGFHRPPLQPSPAAEHAAARLVEISERLGYRVGTATSGGASDGNLTAGVGVPTIDGLGAHGGHAHSPLEFIEEVSVTKKCQLLASFLTGWNGGEIRLPGDAGRHAGHLATGRS
jgi:glutamate carboxypeptidase